MSETSIFVVDVSV